MDNNPRRLQWCLLIGGLFLLWALLGNWFALPGYLRFLERGRTSAAGAAMDGAVVFGAIKTISWMFSFQLGVLFLVVGRLLARRERRSRVMRTVIGGVAWLGIAGIPSLPGPSVAYFSAAGVLVLALVALSLLAWGSGGGAALESSVSSPSAWWRLLGYAFFALASWEVCGLGTTGRILHLDQAVQAGTQGLIITQTTKLMLEFTLAWLFTWLGLRGRGKAGQAL